MMHGENLKLILVRYSELLHVSALYIRHQLGIGAQNDFKKGVV